MSRDSNGERERLICRVRVKWLRNLMADEGEQNQKTTCKAVWELLTLCYYPQCVYYRLTC